MLFGLFCAWALIGLLFFVVWVSMNGGEVYFDMVPRWKQWIVFFLGGPIVWLVMGLSL